MHAELTLPLDISIQGRGSRSDGRSRSERGNEHDAEKANIFSAASGCGSLASRLIQSVRLSLSAAVERVNRSFIAKWILWKGHAVTRAVGYRSAAARGGLGDLKIRLVENVNFHAKDGRVPI